MLRRFAILAFAACLLVLTPTPAHADIHVLSDLNPSKPTSMEWYVAVDAQLRWWSIVQWFEVAAAQAGLERRPTAKPFVTLSVVTSTGSCAIPAYICWRESRGDIHAQNPVSSASGLYQMLDTSFATAARGAGYPQYAGMHAKDAPKDVQDAAARWLWNETGGAAWACC